MTKKIRIGGQIAYQTLLPAASYTCKEAEVGRWRIARPIQNDELVLEAYLARKRLYLGVCNSQRVVAVAKQSPLQPLRSVSVFLEGVVDDSGVGCLSP